MIDHKWIGKTYGPLEYEIGREKMKEYAAAAKDYRPIYHDREFAKQTKYGDIIGMPNFAAVYGLRGAGMMLVDPEIKLNLAMLVHGAQEFEWFGVVKPGDVITETGKVAEIYEKGNLDFIVYEGESVNQNGELVCRSRATMIVRGGLMEMTELCTLKYEDIQVGQEIPTFTHVFDRMDAVIYAGASGDFNPIHTNPFFAKEVAMLPDVIAHGLFNMALLGKTVVDWIGDPGYLKKFSVQFRGMVIPGDTVNFKGKVREKLEGNLVVLDVWAEKPDGTIVLKDGEATVYLP